MNTSLWHVMFSIQKEKNNFEGKLDFGIMPD